VSKLLTEHEVSAEYGLNLHTLRDWRYQRRGLPFVKLGKVVRYERAAVEAYIAKHTVAVGP